MLSRRSAWSAEAMVIAPFDGAVLLGGAFESDRGRGDQVAVSVDVEVGHGLGTDSRRTRAVISARSAHDGRGRGCDGAKRRAGGAARGCPCPCPCRCGRASPSSPAAGTRSGTSSERPSGDHAEPWCVSNSQVTAVGRVPGTHRLRSARRGGRPAAALMCRAQPERFTTVHTRIRPHRFHSPLKAATMGSVDGSTRAG
jgi:hypothetical protein